MPLAAQTPARTEGPGSALRNRNFALLWAGQAVSIAGNGIFIVAMPLEVFRFTSNAFDLSVVLSASTIPMLLLLLIAGAVVDRVSRRMVMLIANSVSGIAITVMTVLIVTGHVRFWMLIVLSLVTGTALSFFLPASSAIFRDILPPELLVSGISLSALSRALAQYMAGPLLGGLIVALLGTAWAFGLDAGSFVVAVVCMAAMSRTVRREAADAAGEARGMVSRLVADIGAGMRYCRAQAWLWWSMLAMAAANFACFSPVFILEPLLARHFSVREAVALGFIYAANGVGGTFASVYITRFGAPRRRIAAIWATLAGAGLGAVLLGISSSIWLATAVACVLWGAATYGNTLWLTEIQETVPAELLGRVMSLDWLVSLALTPLGTLAAGALASALGVRTTLVIGGSVAACAGLVVLLPKVREPDRRRIAETAETEAHR